VSTSAVPARAVDPAIDQSTACATEFAAIRVAGDPDAVIVRASDLPGPFRGTITAFGHTTKWSGSIDRWNAADRDGMHDASIVVHADGPIDGIEYAPTWASCTFHAGTRDDGYDRPQELDRPILVVSDPQPIDPPPCTNAYVPTVVMRAKEPDTPGNAIEAGVGGLVRVAVALDEKGTPEHARIARSASDMLNASALDAALHSSFRPAVFRCKPVASGYEFTVEYNV
jgi:TonB family protein